MEVAGVEPASEDAIRRHLRVYSVCYFTPGSAHEQTIPSAIDLNFASLTVASSVASQFGYA